MEDTFLLVGAEPRSVVFHGDNELARRSVLSDGDRHLSLLGRVFHGVGEQVVDDGLHSLWVESHVERLGKGHEVIVQMLLCGHAPEVLVDVAEEGDDVAALDLQPDVARVEAPEFEELVDEAHESVYAALCRLYVLARGLLGFGDVLYRIGEHGEGRAELVGDVGEERGAHLGELFLHLHLLVESQPLTCAARDVEDDGGNEREVERPSPPRVVPRLADVDGEHTLRSHGVLRHGTHVEDVGAGGEIGVFGVGCGCHRSPLMVDALHIILV